MRKLMEQKLFLLKENNFKISTDSILNCITKKTKIIFLANPNNPTGTYLTKNELRYLQQRIPTNVLLVVDDAYWEYVQKKRL